MRSRYAASRRASSPLTWENLMPCVPAYEPVGSSPLTRGKLRTQDRRTDHIRLIPAHAGKTVIATFVRCMTGAHPHSRREYVADDPMWYLVMGSSPLTRGKLIHHRHDGLRARLTPAHAGKTSRSRDPSRPGWSHPRSRGENWKGFTRTSQTSGSSPLTRGKLRAGGDLDGPARLIPAHTGKTCAGPGHAARGPAHPRSRGENGDGDGAERFGLGSSPLTRENTVKDGENDMMEGSSPLTRGKHKLTTAFQFGQGLIPAHAGKTLTLPGPFVEVGAHPRSRGENAARCADAAIERGSSPLTRGKPRAALVSARAGGLIPAHAGKTQSGAPTLSRTRAHPRSRGENIPEQGAGQQWLGSSPLTRGKRRTAQY